MSIKDQIIQWANSKGLRFVDNIGYTNSGCDEIDFEVYDNTKQIKVRKCKKFTYIYLPIPNNTPYKHRYQIKIENGCAYLWRYLFK